jgi:predicted negative regulator of RcsB-dependent stress response
MPTKKISRKKLLKEPDEFISTTAKVLQFLREHRRKVTQYAVVVIALVAAGLGGYSYLRWQQGKAQVIQQQAFKLYQETSNKAANPEGDKANFKKALEKFQEALAVYGWGNVGQVSQVYIGHCFYGMKEYDQAIPAYSRCLDGPFRSLALSGLGYCYEAKGDYAKAAENYQKVAEGDGSPYQEESMLDLARCYEELKQKEKALEVYQKALAKYPKSRLAGFVEWKIGDLKG